MEYSIDVKRACDGWYVASSKDVPDVRCYAETAELAQSDLVEIILLREEQLEKKKMVACV